MNSIEDIFKKYALSNMNDEDTREKLAKNQDIRIKIAEEIVEHIATVESAYSCNETLWGNLKSVQGIAAISELIVKTQMEVFVIEVSMIGLNWTIPTTVYSTSLWIISYLMKI